MHYSIEPRDGFLSFAKNIAKNISNKYSQKLVDSTIKSGAIKVATNAIKTASKRAVQKTAEATGDSTGMKELPPMELHSVETNNETRKERYISPKEIQQIIDELRLI